MTFMNSSFNLPAVSQLSLSSLSAVSQQSLSCLSAVSQLSLLLLSNLSALITNLPDLSPNSQSPKYFVLLFPISISGSFCWAFSWSSLYANMTITGQAQAMTTMALAQGQGTTPLPLQQTLLMAPLQQPRLSLILLLLRQHWSPHLLLYQESTHVHMLID